MARLTKKMMEQKDKEIAELKTLVATLTGERRAYETLANERTQQIHHLKKEVLENRNSFNNYQQCLVAIDNITRDVSSNLVREDLHRIVGTVYGMSSITLETNMDAFDKFCENR